MPIIIFLLALIVVIMLGPLFSGIAALFTAAGALLWGLGLLAVPVVIGALYLLGTLIWCIVWCFNPQLARQIYQNGMIAREQAAAAKKPAKS